MPGLVVGATGVAGVVVWEPAGCVEPLDVGEPLGIGGEDSPLVAAVTATGRLMAGRLAPARLIAVTVQVSELPTSPWLG